MKSVLIVTLLVCLVVPAQATYYEITTDIYTPGLTLQTGDSIYMTDGGFDGLNLHGEDVTATIEGTSTLEEFFGGIWDISCAFNSHLDLSGGQVHEITMNNDATATLSGGRIDQIYSYQSAWAYDNSDPPALVPNPHITIIYSDDLPTVDASNILTGLWGNGSAFSIELHDVSGYSPVMENIEFIPEPATLTLLRRKYR